MNIQDLKYRKGKLEEDLMIKIKDLVTEFEKDTGCNVSAVNVPFVNMEQDCVVPPSKKIGYIMEQVTVNVEVF